MAYEIIVAKFTPDEPDERIDAVLPDGVVGVGAKAFRFKGEVRSLRAPQSLIEVVYENPDMTIASTPDTRAQATPPAAPKPPVR